jgi:hypothetical protein
MKKLTLKQMDKLYKKVKVYDDKYPIYEIPLWKMPFLWVVWLFYGYTTIDYCGWKMYHVKIRGCTYLLKIVEPKNWYLDR